MELIPDIKKELGTKDEFEMRDQILSKEMGTNDETAECLKCGEECGTKLVGDESVLYCPRCNYYDPR